MGQKSLRMTNNPFILPEDASLRSPAEKRKLTICNLFANEKLSAVQIVDLLDESYEHVLDTLIAYKLVHDRRKNPPELVKGERRLSHFML
jgi:hypothetical protein